MDNHLKILKLAAQGELPEKVDDDHIAPLEAFRELINQHYLDAIDASSDGSIRFLELKITLDGRHYLAQLETGPQRQSFFNGRASPVAKWAFSIFSAVLTGLLIFWLRQKLFGK